MDEAAMRAELDDLRELVQTPGWKRIVNRAKNLREALILKVCAATTGEESLRAGAALSSLDLIANWPQSQAEVLARQLDVATKQKVLTNAPAKKP